MKHNASRRTVLIIVTLVACGGLFLPSAASLADARTVALTDPLTTVYHPSYPWARAVTAFDSVPSSRAASWGCSIDAAGLACGEAYSETCVESKHMSQGVMVTVPGQDVKLWVHRYYDCMLYNAPDGYWTGWHSYVLFLNERDPSVPLSGGSSYDRWVFVSQTGYLPGYGAPMECSVDVFAHSAGVPDVWGPWVPCPVPIVG